MYKRLRGVIDSCERKGVIIKGIDTSKEIIISSRGSISFEDIEDKSGTIRMDLNIQERKVIGNVTIIDDEALARHVGNIPKTEFLKQSEEVIIQKFIDCTGVRPGPGNPILNIVNALYRKYYNANRREVTSKRIIDGVSKRDFLRKVTQYELIKMHITVYGDYPRNGAKVDEVVNQLYDNIGGF